MCQTNFQTLSPRYTWCRVVIAGVLWFFGAKCNAEELTPTEALEQKNASERAYNMFSITLSAEDYEGPKGYAHSKQLKHVVFENGVVQDSWSPSTVDGKENEDRVRSLFHHDQYADRISFDFFFGSFQNYDISTPRSSSSDPKVSKPKVIEFQNDPEERAGSFSVVYDCQRPRGDTALQNVSVSVVFPIVSGLSIMFSFRKTCGGGKHNYLEFGLYEESENAASEVSRAPFTESSELLTVGPHVMSTKLYLHLHPPARTQEFFHVSVNSSSSSLETIPKGPTFGGVLTQSESSVLHVLYECHGRGRFEVIAKIPIYPFDPLIASWMKDCGGGVAQGLHVGSGPLKKDDVVQKGRTVEEWTLGLYSTSASISRKAPVVNSSVRHKEFWLSNDGFSLKLAPPVITVEKPGILSVFPQRGYSRGSIYRMESDGLLPRDDALRVRMRLICKKKGRSMVVVTIPIKSFRNTEFGFVKECRAPRRYEHSGFLRTAESVMVTVSLFMLASFAYWWKVHCGAGLETREEKPAPGY